MKALALVLVGIVAATGCKHVFGPSVKGSGMMGTRTVTVGTGKTLAEFSKVETYGALDIEIRQGPQSDVVITGDDNIVNLVTLQVSDDTLTIKTSGSYSTHNPLKLAVTIPSVEKIDLSGSGNATVSDVSGGQFAVDLSGSGNIVATGSATRFFADISGSGNIDASGLTSEEANTSLSGSGNIKVNASKTLTASVSGSGDILYKGSPKVDKDIDGSGNIKPL